MKLFTGPSKYTYLLFRSDKDYVPVLFIISGGLVLNTRVDAIDVKI